MVLYGTDRCIFRPAGVMCAGRECEGCGFNPVVEAARKVKLAEKRIEDQKAQLRAIKERPRLLEPTRSRK